MPNRYQDTRHTLLVHCTFCYGVFNNAGSSWDCISAEVEKLRAGQCLTLGRIRNAKGEIISSSTNREKKYLFLALEYYCRVVMQLKSVTTIRVARGVRRLKSVAGNAHSYLLWWKPGSEDIMCFERDGTGIDVAQVAGNTTGLCMMQVLIGKEDEHLAQEAKAI